MRSLPVQGRQSPIVFQGPGDPQGPGDGVLESLATAVLAHPADPGQRLVLLIDGGSGSGKTTLAQHLRARLLSRLGRTSVQLVSLEDVYPGWHGLQEASDAVITDILRPQDPGYRRWDWVQDRPADWVPLDPTADLIVEGCGAITKASAALATSVIWIDSEEETRSQRALARDGDAFAPWWDVWEAQEHQHWARHSPWGLADVVLHN